MVLFNIALAQYAVLTGITQSTYRCGLHVQLSDPAQHYSSSFKSIKRSFAHLRYPSMLCLASSKTRITFFAKESTRVIMTTKHFASFPVTESIKSKLEDAFGPTSHLEVINESHKHNVPDNSETHFKVIIVSPVFNSCKNLIQRHRLVNEALRDELAGPVHALSIVAKSPEQWADMKAEGKTISPSPSCRGGDGSLSSSRMLRQS